MQKAIISKVLKLDNKTPKLENLWGMEVTYDSLCVQVNVLMSIHYKDENNKDDYLMFFIIKTEDKLNELIIQTENSIFYLEKVN